MYYLVRFRDVAVGITCHFIFGVKTMCYVDLVVSYLIVLHLVITSGIRNFITLLRNHLFSRCIIIMLTSVSCHKVEIIKERPFLTRVLPGPCL